MPVYLYQCGSCQAKQEAYRKIDERHDAPACACGGVTALRITSTMVSVFNPYMPVAGDQEDGKKRLIRTRGEHEAFLRRNGYEEVGNDKSVAPKSSEEIAERQKAWKDSPDAPMVDVEKLKKEGWVAEDLTV